MGTLIRAGQTPEFAGRLHTVDLADHLAQADAILRDARTRAARMIEAAKEQIATDRERAMSEAHAQGFLEGRQQGLEEGRAQALQEARERFDTELSSLAEQFAAGAEGLAAIREEVRTVCESQAIDFAMDVAGKLTLAIGEARPQAAIENLKRALDFVEGQTVVRVRVHPSDESAMRSFADEYLRRARESRGMDIVTDSQLAPGGCVVEAEHSVVDASLEEQLAQLVSLIRGRSERDA